MKKIIDKVAWICLENKHVLMSKSLGKEKYYIAGGKRESGESDIACLIREIKEELSVDIIHDSVSFYGSFEAQAHGQPEGVIVRMSCYIADYTGEIAENNEIELFEWFKFADKDRGAFVDHLIFDDLKRKNLIE